MWFRYDPFTVAETVMGDAPTGQESGSGPKGKQEGESAFGRLAGYIFGKNSRKEKMSMTAPVFSNTSGRLQFVMDKSHQVSQDTVSNHHFDNSIGALLERLKHASWPGQAGFAIIIRGFLGSFVDRGLGSGILWDT